MSRIVPPNKIIFRSESISLELHAPSVNQIHDVNNAVQDSLEELKPFMNWAHLQQSPQAQLDRMIEAIPAYWQGTNLSVHGYTPTGDFVCGAGLHMRIPLNSKGYEIGYWVRKKYQGQGYATLLTKMLIVTAFDLLKSDRIQISHNFENAASRRVIEKCEFIREGEMRNALAECTAEQIAGSLNPCRTIVQYALIPEDYANLSWASEIRAGLTYEFL